MSTSATTTRLSGSSREPVADRYLDLTLDRLLDEVAARQSAPGGGSVAAIAVALAAGLVGMAARFSDRQLPEHEQLADEADQMRQEVAGLADADAEAYAGLLADGRSAEALLRATEIPLQVCDRGLVVAELAVRLAENGNPNVRGDAVTGLLLAAAAVRSAAHLVKLNAEAADDLHDCVRRADADVAAVADALRRAGLAD